MKNLREFLRPKNPAAATRAGEVIRKSMQLLGHQPHIGRPVEDLPDQYVVRYRIDAKVVTILAIRHQKEAGY